MPSDPFMIRAHVPQWEAHVADYQVASDATRRANPSRRTLTYGNGPDETLDIYVPKAERTSPRPIHLFIHGGYWRAFSKDDYAFVADSITAAGAIAAIMDYSLMPAARMAGLIAQVRRAADWLVAEAPRFGGDPRAFSASGHSAGAHLASFLVCRAAHEPEVALPAVRSVLLVSGIYDLDPITRSFLQPELQLRSEEVARWSPIRTLPDRQAVVSLLVGAAETQPFHEQAGAFAAHLASVGGRSQLTTVAGEDHMTIIRELGRPGSACAAFLSDTIRASSAP